jgi:predicted RNA-binding protein with PIN domain
VVVFDGKGVKEQMVHVDHICVIYSCYGVTADDVIARLAGEARDKGVEVMTFSDDGEVKQNVVKQGGHALTTHGLVSSLNAAPQDVAQRSVHRQEMRRVYGIDPAAKFQQDEEDARKPQAKKKGKSSRRYKSLRLNKRTLK